jgi:hypothetical protein
MTTVSLDYYENSADGLRAFAEPKGTAVPSNVKELRQFL